MTSDTNDRICTLMFDLCDDGENYSDSDGLTYPQSQEDIETYAHTYVDACERSNSMNSTSSFSSGFFSGISSGQQ